MTRILFVCLGNICRSPLAEAVFGQLAQAAGVADQFEVDSAGTAGYHVDERPHRGSRRIAATHGVALDGRARQLTQADFETFDWFIAMDRANLNALMQAHPQGQSRIRLLLAFANGADQEVHDPYYDGDFELTFRQVDAGCRGLLDHLINERP